MKIMTAIRVMPDSHLESVIVVIVRIRFIIIHVPVRIGTRRAVTRTLSGIPGTLVGLEGIGAPLAGKPGWVRPGNGRPPGCGPVAPEGVEAGRIVIRCLNPRLTSSTIDSASGNTNEPEPPADHIV
jgi:hypothetical protein